MAVFDSPAYRNHDVVVFGSDPESGLRAIIAVHSTRLGPSLGGCRMWPYDNDVKALEDVLRLSHAMSYKAAVAQLPLGGGKSVIIGDPATDKSEELFAAMGRMVAKLNGRYILAQDSGISVDDLGVMARQSQFVCGDQEYHGKGGEKYSEAPSPATALGVFLGIKAAVQTRMGRDDLHGLKVSIKGLGNVGYDLARHLHGAGAGLFVSDINAENCERAAGELGAEVVDGDAIYSCDADVYAPCAMGGAINDNSLARLAARVCIIAGCANNQLARAEHDDILKQRNILYAPDYVINAGGLIHCYYLAVAAPDDLARRSGKQAGDDPKALAATLAHQHTCNIPDTLTQIFERSANSGKGTAAIADQLAEERLAAGPQTP